MDPGRDPTAGLVSGLIVIGTVNIICALSDPVPIDTVDSFLLGRTVL